MDRDSGGAGRPQGGGRDAQAAAAPVLDRARLLREGTDLVELVSVRLVRRLGKTVRLDELRAMGASALPAIVERFDPGRAKFKTYALMKLRWAIYDALRRETHARATAAPVLALLASERYGAAFDPEELGDDVLDEERSRNRLSTLLEGHAAALAIGLVAADKAYSDETVEGPDPEESAMQRQSMTALQQAITGLPERERALIERHYFGGERFDEIADELGISKSWASRLHVRAIQSLGKALRDR